MLPSHEPPKPLLILLPGLDGTGKLFGGFMGALQAHVEARVVSYPLDLPLGYEALEALVRTQLPTDRPFALLGESFSGPLVIRIAADPPPGLAAAILCVTFARNPFPLLAWLRPLITALPIKSLPRWTRSLFLWGKRASHRMPDPPNRAVAAVDSVVLRHRIGAMLGVDATTALTRITLPLLVVQASADNVVPAAATTLILRLQPRARHVRIEGPHLLLQSCAQPCADVVAPFVRDAIMLFQAVPDGGIPQTANGVTSGAGARPPG